MTRRSHDNSRSCWKPPNDDMRRGALGKVHRPAALVAACKNAPCFPRYCVDCTIPSSDTVATNPLQQYQCCPHSHYQPGYFQPKTVPRFNDWLNDAMPGQDERKGQSFDAFMNTNHKSKPSKSRSVLYLVDFDNTGDSTTDHSEAARQTMEILCEFVEIYFGLPCQLLEPLTSTERKKLRGRSDPIPQLLTGPLESILDKRKRKIKNAFCIAGVTMVDLYPGKGWNFVFGEACPERGVGVFSFARYTCQFDQAWDEAFSAKDHKQGYDATAAWPRDPTNRSQDPDNEGPCVLLRAMKTLTHEILHLFYLEHCPFFQCVMNGANHLGEMDESPLHLCPVCLRKLHRSVASSGKPLDLLGRYERLAAALSKWGMEHDAMWYRAALERCRNELNKE